MMPSIHSFAFISRQAFHHPNPGQSHEAIRTVRQEKCTVIPIRDVGIHRPRTANFRNEQEFRLPCNLDSGDPCRNDEVLAFMRLPW